MDDLYQTQTPDAPPAAPPDAQPDQSATPKDNARGAEDTPTSALLPRALVGELEPGDTITLKIVHIYDDEVEVASVGKGAENDTDKEIEDLDEEE